MKQKPIRVFYSDMTSRFYASRHYRIVGEGTTHVAYEVTGEKFDVTDQIAAHIVEKSITFNRLDDAPSLTRPN